MLDHDLLATAYDFQDDDTALSYVNQLDDIEQSMDHNAVITIDNARVSIKVRTGDIDGLSRLDFEFALRANDLAKQLQADQLPHATNAINEQQFDENCWKGYHKEGNKKMFGKTVPNCVKNEAVVEGGTETSWSDGTEKITLQDILDLTKHIKQINLPINDNLKSKLIHWDGNPEEIERINQVTVSTQFPILIIVDEQGQIKSILDGNHRLHKAIRSQAKTIPAKLINPSDLSDKAKRIFHIKEQGVTEELCPECGGAMYPESMLNEKQDACYYKVKSRYKVWPSAYASGALVQCRKKGAANWGNKSAKESIEENFADGKGPGRPGDSQRHGIPKGATMAQLEKAVKASGRKGQLARWQINMRRGKKK
jgi:pterin-4a-carbinolamine dehydratase